MVLEPATTSISTLPQTLEARPPTPPRGFFGRFLNLGVSSSSPRNLPSSQNTPTSSAESPMPTPTSFRKKVGFSDSAEYKEPPTVEFDGKGLSHPVQPLAPSAERKPSKSILKAYNGLHEPDFNSPVESKLLPAHQYENFSKMLESILRSLGGSDRLSKLDAYLSISGSLKASDNIPDLKVLKEELPQLCQYIQRDCNAKLDSGKPDSQLITNALILLSTFFPKPIVNDAIPHDFTASLVDQAIRIFEDGSMSKEVVKHFMFMLAQQKFSARFMNQERVGRLVSVLHRIETHYKGQSIIIQRIQIYRTLLRQSTSHMAMHTVWVQDLFVDMMASPKETRTQAAVLGLEAGLTVGTEKRPSREMMDLFKRSHLDVPSFAEFYANRLQKMVKNKDDSALVPRIWSVIMLFFRYNPKALPAWQFLNDFLNVINSCFNSSDVQTKTEAHYAWNRLIFAILPNKDTPPRFLDILANPLRTQLMARKSGRKATLSSVYTLLYYSLKPTSSSEELDLFWNKYVVSLVGEALISGGREMTDKTRNSTEACIILESLFDSANQRPWSETRAMDNLHQNTMIAKELPALDSRWLRKSSQRIFPLLGSLLEKLFWDLSDESSPISAVWRSYIRTISLPNAMDIRVSLDTMGSVASSFSTLYRIWNAGPGALGALPPTKADQGTPGTLLFLGSFESLVMIAVNGLGVGPFTDRLLSSTQDTFIVIATPSNQPKKLRNEMRTPLHHLLHLFTVVSPGLEYDGRFLRMIRNILQPFFEAERSNKARIQLAKDLANILPTTKSEPTILIWQILTEFATKAIDTRDRTDAIVPQDGLLGNDYRIPVRILETGARLSARRPLPGWSQLLDATVNSATIDAGDAGRAVAVVEPLARALGPGSSAGLVYLHFLLLKANYPRDRQAFDVARKRMWGTAPTGFGSSSFDPYSHLYDFIRVSLETAYVSFTKAQILDYSNAINATVSLLHRCPSALHLGALSRIQQGVSPWVADTAFNAGGGTALSHAILALWSFFCATLPRLQDLHGEKKVLADLEVLICSGLESKHKTIVTATIRLWNSTFGTSQKGFTYSNPLKSALLRLRPVADIQLPFFPDSLESEGQAANGQAPVFAETQDEIPSALSTPNSAFRSEGDPGYIRSIERKIKQSQPLVLVQGRYPQSRKRPHETTPDLVGRNSKRRDVTPRLRHDDSQVQFEAIESSPMADRTVDSQLLTDKQKEVKERQRADAAMFPDLRSSSPSFGVPREKTPADLELPSYRSSSKRRSKTPPAHVQRQSTPNLVLPSDDDQFVASSPTPTRPTRIDVEMPDPPSSPPQAPQRLDLFNRAEMSSSPPQTTPEPEYRVGSLTTSIKDGEMPASSIEELENVGSERPIEKETPVEASRTPEKRVSSSQSPVEVVSETNSSSLDPSAQVDPYALENMQPFSTYESTPKKLDISISNISVEALIAEKESSVVVGIAPEVSLQPVGITEPLLTSKSPSTPTKLISNSPVQSTPRYVDAPTSPARSDKQPEEEEVFEDAVSSPRFHMPASRPIQSPSSLCDMDIDESSMMRLAAKYDVMKPEFVVDDVVENGGIVPAKDLSPANSSGLRKSPRRSEDSVERSHASSVSLIPETPALLVKLKDVEHRDATAEQSRDSSFHDGKVEVDMSETIIVDDRDFPYTPRHEVPPFGMKKRVMLKKKHEWAAALHDIPVASPLAKSISRNEVLMSTKAIHNKASKKPRDGRRRSHRNSQMSEEVEASTSLDDNQSQSQMSMDLDRGDTKQDESTDLPSSAADIRAEMMKVKDVDSPPAELELEKEDHVEDEMDIDHVAPITAATGADIAEDAEEDAFDISNPILSQDYSAIALEVVEETVLQAASSEVDANLLDEAAMHQPEESAASFAPEKALAGEKIQEVEVTKSQAIKNQLRDLIANLQGAALSREEVHAFEDLLMDAKRQLYDAELRGRISVDR